MPDDVSNKNNITDDKFPPHLHIGAYKVTTTKKPITHITC